MSALDLKALAAAAAETEDLNVDKSGFERKPLEEGACLLRLRDYIETGRYASKNPAYKPGLKVDLVFEVSSKKHLVEIDGKKVPALMYVSLGKGSTATSQYKKLFNSMNKALGGTHKNFLTMIDQPLKAHITQNKVGEGKDQKIYANLDEKGVWSFVPAVREVLDEDGEVESSTPINVKELHGNSKVFMWENEGISDDMVVAMWETLFIDGTREDKDKNVVSKNTIQEKIMTNLEWVGSRTEALTQENLVDDSLLEADESDLAEGATAPEDEDVDCL